MPSSDGQQQPQRDVGRAHAAGGVHARREHERHVVAVDRLPREARALDERAQADLVRARATARRGRGSAMTRFSPTSGHDVGQRADGRDLDERGQPGAVPGPRGRAPGPASGPRPTPARFLSGYVQSAALRVDHGERLGQLVVGLVVVRDDEIDAEFPGPPRGLGAADPAVDRDDDAHALARAAARWPACSARSRRASARARSAPTSPPSISSVRRTMTVAVMPSTS